MSFIKSSIGKKVTMSLTGLFLVSFLIIHLIGNLQILKLDDGYAFNSYAKFMTTNPLIKTVSYLLYASILYHAIAGLALAFKNYGARKEKYAVANKSTSPWTSRYMGILGTIILVFIVVHMGDFWREYKFEEGFEQKSYFVYDYGTESHSVTIDDPDDMQAVNKQLMIKLEAAHGEANATKARNGNLYTYKDLYSEVREAFEDPLYVLLYVFSMLAIMFHLWHGFKSAFQTLGVNHPNVNKLIQVVGGLISTVIPLAFAFIPLYIYFNH